MPGNAKSGWKGSHTNPSGTPHAEEEAGIKFYVTDDCNGCGLCKSIAPEFFDCIDYAYSYFLVRQPRTEQEVILLRDASSFCVLDAICETPETQA